MSREATERRLRAGGLLELEPGEEIVAWCRAWVSRAGLLQRFAARWRDVIVVTDRRLLLFGVGHFSRRPRRLMLADLLENLTVTDVGVHPGRGLRCSRPGRPPVLIELDADPWSLKVGLEIQTRATRPSAPDVFAPASGPGAEAEPAAPTT
jgi:hypothetical protein